MGEKKSVVAPRKNMEARPVYGTSNPYELDGKDPDYVYQAFSSDPRHPSYVGKALRPKRCHGGAMAEPWQVCQESMDPQLQQLQLREDQGKGVDTALRAGSQIICKTPKENFELLQAEDKAEVDHIASSMRMTRREHVGKTTTVEKFFDSDSVQNHEAQRELDSRPQ